MDDSNLAGCLPQLVQALKFDPYDFSELGLLLIERSIMNPLVIGVPFFWCCNVELRHVHCRSRYAMYIHEYKSRCGTQQRVLLERQHMLWAETGLFAKVAFSGCRQTVTTPESGCISQIISSLQKSWGKLQPLRQVEGVTGPSVKQSPTILRRLEVCFTLLSVGGPDVVEGISLQACRSDVP